MKKRYIARELFKRTRGQATFTVNDLRKNKFNELFSHYNQIGSFFKDLAKEGLVMKAGADQAEHREAKGRWVWKWHWTEKARALFG